MTTIDTQSAAFKAACNAFRLAMQSKFSATDEALAGAIAAWEKAQWQPIETAPKDGTWFLAREADDHLFTAAYHSEGYFMVKCGQPVVSVPEPTHWRPLPTPPEPDNGWRDHTA